MPGIQTEKRFKSPNEEKSIEIISGPVSTRSLNNFNKGNSRSIAHSRKNRSAAMNSNEINRNSILKNSIEVKRNPILKSPDLRDHTNSVNRNTF